MAEPAGARPLDLCAGRLFFWHCAAIAAFVAAHLAGLQLLAGRGPVSEKFFHQYLDLNSEGTAATYFSALGLLAAALVSAHLARRAPSKASRRFWLLAAALLLFFSVDEATSIHEGFTVIGKAVRPQEGVFYFAWWAPYLVALAPVAALMAPGLWRLESRTRVGLLLGTALFLAGALGLELVESGIAEQIAAGVGTTAPLETLERRFALLVAAEEALEMLGVAVALNVLLRHAAEVAPHATLRLRAEDRAPASPLERKPRAS